MQFQQGNLLKGIEKCLFDLQYKLVRSPRTTVSATSFLYFKLKVYKRLPKSKKLPMLKKCKNIYIVKSPIQLKNYNFEPFCPLKVIKCALHIREHTYEIWYLLTILLSIPLNKLP